eukprot:jgi/Mesen1/3397/ME000192S02566
MNISSLLTAMGVNLGLMCLCFALYSTFSKQPINARIYYPRHFLQEIPETLSRERIPSGSIIVSPKELMKFCQ